MGNYRQNTTAAEIADSKAGICAKKPRMDPMFDATPPLTTYEQTTLNLQQASLTLQQANVEAMLAGNDIAWWVGITQATVALTVGLIQAGVVGWGIRYMIRMGERREQHHADRHEETMRAFEQQASASREQQASASREQHAATMRALEALIERTAPPQ